MQNNEDATFRKLARRPFDEVDQQIKELWAGAKLTHEEFHSRGLKILEDSYWDVNDWNREAKAANEKRDRLPYWSLPTWSTAIDKGAT